MTVWIVRNYEDELVDIFKTKEGAYSYLKAELTRWNNESPTDFDDSTYGSCKEILFNSYLDQRKKFFMQGYLMMMVFILKPMSLKLRSDIND